MRRDVNEDWKKGFVTSLDPLMVDNCMWDEVRLLTPAEEATEAGWAAAMQATGKRR